MKFEHCKVGQKIKYNWYDLRTGEDQVHQGIIYKVSKDKIKANQVVLVSGHKDRHLVFTHESLIGVEVIE